MKKIYLSLVLFSIFGFSQNKTEAEKKVHEGISFHDDGKYNEALTKYEEALVLDKDNSFALTEKAMTLEASKRYDESIEVCKSIFKLYPYEDNKTVYVTYGNSLDHSGKFDLAVKAYDEGIKKYPNYYQLHFNKGITLFGAKENSKAINSFQKATILNPNHSSSFNALGVLEKPNRIASILSSARYLTIDNKSSRSKGNLESIISLMKQGVTQNKDNSINLTIDEKSLDKINKKISSENDFSAVDLVLSMSAALDYDEKNKDKTEIQKFSDKFVSICQSMKELKKNQKGYYWDFLAPYFIEMNDRNLVEVFSNIIFLSSKNNDAIKYVESNSNKIEEFNEWNKNHKWK